MAASAPLRDPLLPLFYPRLRMWTHTGTEWLSGDRDTATERRGGRRGSEDPCAPPPTLGLGRQRASAGSQQQGPRTLSRRLPGQSSATVRRGQVPGSRTGLARTSTGSEAPDGNARAHTYTHSRARHWCHVHGDTKSQRGRTLHIMSIVSKEKRFMELKHPQEGLLR